MRNGLSRTASSRSSYEMDRCRNDADASCKACQRKRKKKRKERKKGQVYAHRAASGSGRNFLGPSPIAPFLDHRGAPMRCGKAENSKKKLATHLLDRLVATLLLQARRTRQTGLLQPRARIVRLRSNLGLERDLALFSRNCLVRRVHIFRPDGKPLIRPTRWCSKFVVRFESQLQGLRYHRYHVAMKPASSDQLDLENGE